MNEIDCLEYGHSSQMESTGRLSSIGHRVLAKYERYLLVTITVSSKTILMDKLLRGEI